MNSQPVPYSSVSTRRSPWWIVLVVGILVTAASLGLLVWPFVAASWVLVILFGSALIANGLAILVRVRPSVASTVGGSLLVLAGVLSIVFSEFTATALVTFVGVALIVLGASWIAVAIRLGIGSHLLALLPGAGLLVAGIVALVWPGIALGIVAVVVGFCMLLLGVSTIGFALRLRKLSVTSTTIVM